MSRARETLRGNLSKEQKAELRLVGEMRNLIDRSNPRFSGSAAVYFNSLFPPGEPVTIYNPETIKPDKSVEYTSEEKAMAKAAMSALGYVSATTPSSHKPHEVQSLHVGFSNDESAFVNVVNKMPFIHGLHQGQVQPMGTKQGEGTIITRELHSMHLANTVLRDLVRMALKSSDLFIEQVQKDMAFYGVDINALKGVRVHPKGINFPPDCPEDKKDAVTLAMQYGTYLVLFAYLHDERTPGLGDGVMKGKARFPGQTSFNYSEDEELRKGIAAFAKRASSKLPELFDKKSFNLDASLFVKITEDLSSEKGKTLGAQLMKNKRKFDKADDALSEAFLNKKEFSDPASLDLDQASGLLINMFDLCTSILPGGFKIPRSNRGIPASEMPFGSYTDRLMLLMYAQITGMTKAELTAKLAAKNIPVERVYIAAEEFIVGANFSLRKLPELGDAIVRVALNPVTVKRMMQTFAALTYFNYNSDSFSGTERMIQDIITAMNKQDPTTIETFVNRSDADVLDILTRRYTEVIDHIYHLFPQKMERLTEYELKKRIKKSTKHVFYSRAKIYPVAKKEGTFVQTSHGVHPYSPHVDPRFHPRTGYRVENKFALPKKLARIEADIKNHSYYHYIELSEEEVQEIKRLIAESPKPLMRRLLTQVMRCWETPLQLSDGTILKKDNEKIQFRLDVEKPEGLKFQLPPPDEAESIFDPPELEQYMYILDTEHQERHVFDNKP